ncbi:MAG: HAMP domain-containing protein [Gammaproteobacteria bacterium]|nr:HAMP domain-containing protein [Gammaproteobacteria bacterium]
MHQESIKHSAAQANSAAGALSPAFANDAHYGAAQDATVPGKDAKRRRFGRHAPMWLNISISFGLPFFACIIALGLMSLNSQRDFQQQQLDEFANVITAQLAATLTEPMFADALLEIKVLISQVPLTKNVIGVAAVDHRGQTLANAGHFPLLENIEIGENKQLLSPAHFYPEMGRNNASIKLDQYRDAVLYSAPATFRDVVGGHAMIVIDRNAMNAQFEQMRIAIIFATSIMTLFLVGVVVWGSRRVVSPMTSIVDAAKRIQHGDRTLILERRDDELGQLISAINDMTRGLSEKSQIERALQKFLAPDVASKILKEIDTVDLRGENVEATVLFADIVGFTSMSEQMSPEQVSEMLNEYFSYYSACAKLYFGTVDKFLGDCIMLVFGATNEDKLHRYHAAACAVLMQKLTASVNVLRETQGLEPIYLRIGINSGKMLAGLLGSNDRLEYTVIGDSVNLASRLCNEAERDQIVIQQEFVKHLTPHCVVEVDKAKTIRVRGKSDSINIYNLNALKHAKSSGDKALVNDLLAKHRGALAQFAGGED